MYDDGQDGLEGLSEITSDGDVILVVGVENTRLRVNSQSLRYASKVFSAMFGPDWSEGQRLSKQLPTEIALPDDDAKAMRTICCTIHLRNDLIPETLTTKEVLQIAIEIDKYDLMVALRYAIIEWLKPRFGMGLVETGHLLAAAFLLNTGSSEIFMVHAKALFFDHSKSYFEIIQDELIRSVLPLELACM
jgi:hypothetical protein